MHLYMCSELHMYTDIYVRVSVSVSVTELFGLQT